MKSHSYKYEQVIKNIREIAQYNRDNGIKIDKSKECPCLTSVRRHEHIIIIKYNVIEEHSCAR